MARDVETVTPPGQPTNMPITVVKGVWAGGLGLLGAGAIMVAPTQLWIGWGLIAAGALLFLWGIRLRGHHFWSRTAWRQPQPDQSIVVGPVLHSEQRGIVDGRGREIPGVAAASFLLAVGNGRTDGRTLRNVQAKLHLASDVIVLRTADGRSRIDIQHGEHAKFALGWTATSELVGMHQSDPLRIENRDELDGLLHNHRHDHRSLRVGPRMAVGSLKPPAEAAFPLLIIVSADDMPAKAIQFKMNLHKLPDVKAAFSTAVAEEQA